MSCGALACLLGGALRKRPSFLMLSLLSLLRFACEMQRLVSALRFVAGNSARAAATISLIGRWLRDPPGQMEPQNSKRRWSERWFTVSLQWFPPAMVCRRELCSKLLAKGLPHQRGFMG
jgi:hypothetical protein